MDRYISDPRAPTDTFPTIFGRTELIIGASRAKSCEEVDGEVRLPVQPPKLALKGETNVSRPKNFLEKTDKRKKDPIDQIFLGVSHLRLYSIIDKKYCNEFVDNSIFKKLDYKNLIINSKYLRSSKINFFRGVIFIKE